MTRQGFHHGRSIGRFRNLEIVDARQMLNDVLPSIVPLVDPNG
jgi:hypothetical protein